MTEQDMRILWPLNVRSSTGNGDHRGARPRRPAPRQTPSPPAGSALPAEISLGRSREFPSRGAYNWRNFRAKFELEGGVVLPAAGSPFSASVTQDALAAEVAAAIRQDLEVAAEVELDSDAYASLSEAIAGTDPHRFGTEMAKLFGISAALDLEPVEISVGMDFDEDLCFWNIEATYERRLLTIRLGGVPQEVRFSGGVTVSFGPSPQFYQRIAQRIGGRALRAAIQRWGSRVVSRAVMSQIATRLAATLAPLGIFAVTLVVTAAITLGVLVVIAEAHRQGRQWAGFNQYSAAYIRRTFSGLRGHAIHRAPRRPEMAVLGWNDAGVAHQTSGWPFVHATLIRNFARGLRGSGDVIVQPMIEQMTQYLREHHEEVQRHLSRRDSQHALSRN